MLYTPWKWPQLAATSRYHIGIASLHRWIFFRFLTTHESTTGCPVLSDFFQKPLRGTYIPQLLMTNDSFSSQTWAIYVPNRNSDVKSILWPPELLRVRSQNDGYWQNLSKFIGKIGIFTKLCSNFLSWWDKDCLHSIPVFQRSPKLSLMRFKSHLEAKQPELKE